MQKRTKNHCPTCPTMHIHSFIPRLTTVPPTLAPRRGADGGGDDCPDTGAARSALASCLNSYAPSALPLSHATSCRGDACVARVPQTVDNQQRI
ncbi:MAG: hypothetical protein IJ835_02640 [Muribaculaceae bacterium]|nr:hypothetical protein [Muribaculaceae bacterium]